MINKINLKGLIFSQEAFDYLGSNDKKLVIFENSVNPPMVAELELFEGEVIQFIDQNK